MYYIYEIALAYCNCWLPFLCTSHHSNALSFMTRWSWRFSCSPGIMWLPKSMNLFIEPFNTGFSFKIKVGLLWNILVYHYRSRDENWVRESQTYTYVYRKYSFTALHLSVIVNVNTWHWNDIVWRIFCLSNVFQKFATQRGRNIVVFEVRFFDFYRAIRSIAACFVLKFNFHLRN